MNTSAERARPPLLPLAVICVLALWLRIPGISAGLPYFYAEDEAHHFNRVVEMVKEGRYDPQYFHKPSLHFYLRMPVVALSYLWGAKQGHLKSVQEIETRNSFGLAGYQFTASHPGVVKWNRALSVILSVLTVIFCYLLCFELTGSMLASITASLLLSVSPEFLINSPIVGVDILMALACTVSVYLALLTYRSFSLWKLLLLGLSCGLAISSKYNAAPIALLPLAVVLVREDFRALPLIIALLSPIVGFFAGSPFILVSLPLFLDHLSYELWHYGVAGHAGHSAEPGLQQALFYTRWLVRDGIGILAAIFALVGFTFLLTPQRRAFAIFLLYPLFFAGLMISQKTNFTRNMVSFLPFAAVLAALGLERALYAIRVRPRMQLNLFMVFIPALCIQPLIGSLRHVQTASKTVESRSELIEWLRESRPNLVDIAISGELMLPTSIYREPGIVRIDPAKENSFSLIQKGFKTVITGPESLIQETRPFLNQLRTFPGEGPQRIVRNPKISVYELQRPLASAYLRSNPDTPKPFALHVPLADSNGEGGMILCQDNLGKELRADGEDYCWLQQVFSSLVIAPSSAGAVNGKSKLSLEVMSPWENQVVTFRFGPHEQRIELPPASAGLWTTVSVDLPREALKDGRGIFVELAEVHSPRAWGLSADPRHLGLAIRRFSLS